LFWNFLHGVDSEHVVSPIAPSIEVTSRAVAGLVAMHAPMTAEPATTAATRNAKLWLGFMILSFLMNGNC
jgi:hypothetical protein